MLRSRMHDLLTASGDGAGCVLLEGDAGIGKSRVIDELLSAGLPQCGGRGLMLFGRADAASKSQVQRLDYVLPDHVFAAQQERRVAPLSCCVCFQMLGICSTPGPSRLRNPVVCCSNMGALELFERISCCDSGILPCCSNMGAV